MPDLARPWKIYALLSTFLAAGFALLAFRAGAPPPVLTAQRINIVGPDGKLQMVISSRQDMPEGVVDGQTFRSQGRHQGAGMIFYNSLGDEDGGLTFGASRNAKGYAADAGLMFDQFKQDQTVGLTYTDENGRRSSGLRVWQRPNRDLADEIHSLEAAQRLPAGAARTAAEKKAVAGNALRLFAGRMPDASSALVLNDAQGHPRLRLSVTAQGAAQIDFLNAQGKVIRSLTARP